MLASAPPPAPPSKPPAALVKIMDMHPRPGVQGHPFKGIRKKAQHRAAFTLGVQGGAHWRYERIDKSLEARAHSLDRIYDFRPFLLSNDRVMPPVVVRTKRSFTLVNDTTAHASRATFKIVTPARIVTQPPSWRHYLIRHYKTLEKPNPVLLPRDSDERARWKRVVKEGWRVGVKQAKESFHEALAKLTRDFLGVARFRWLAREGVVSLPYLAKGDLGIRIKHNTLTVGGRVYRITAPARWQKEAKWKALGATHTNRQE